MTLNHLNLTVADPSETSAFLAKYFGLQPRGGNLGIQMLNDDRGMVLTLIKARPEDRVEGVDEINRRLRDDGFPVDAPAHLHGSWTFYFTAPGGFTVEVLS